MRAQAINPGFVIGPPLSARTDSTSVRFCKNLLDGRAAKGAVPFCDGCVDVRDVARLDRSDTLWQ